MLFCICLYSVQVKQVQSVSVIAAVAEDSAVVLKDTASDVKMKTLKKISVYLECIYSINELNRWDCVFNFAENTEIK